jgi:hypothetical protein
LQCVTASSEPEETGLAKGRHGSAICLLSLARSTVLSARDASIIQFDVDPKDVDATASSLPRETSQEKVAHQDGANPLVYVVRPDSALPVFFLYSNVYTFFVDVLELGSPNSHRANL